MNTLLAIIFLVSILALSTRLIFVFYTDTDLSPNLLRLVLISASAFIAVQAFSAVGGLAVVALLIVTSSLLYLVRNPV